MLDLPPSFVDLDAAAALLRSGRLCAFPTETVYGLGADATDAEAVLAIYTTKGRPRFNPLIVHCADLEMARQIAEFSPLAERLAAAWPGPLTLVLPLRHPTSITDIVTAGLDTIGIRIPDHDLARALIATVGRPLAAPSANPSGRLSPTTAEQVDMNFGARVPVLDGGACRDGVESSIVAIDGETAIQLRPGAMALAEIESLAGRKVGRAQTGAKVAAPGMMASHYAPGAQVRLGATTTNPGEVLLGFGAVAGELNLSPAGDLNEAARNLFSMLHALDALKPHGIAVAPIPETGLGEAINDRLRRAAAPR